MPRYLLVWRCIKPKFCWRRAKTQNAEIFQHGALAMHLDVVKSASKVNYAKLRNLKCCFHFCWGAISDRFTKCSPAFKLWRRARGGRWTACLRHRTLMPWDQNIEKRCHPRSQPRFVHHQRDHGHDHHQSWKQTCIILQTANCLSTASPWHRVWVDLRLFWCLEWGSVARIVKIVQKLSFKTIMRDDFGVDACQKNEIRGDCTSTLSILWRMCAPAHKIETQANEVASILIAFWWVLPRKPKRW